MKMWQVNVIVVVLVCVGGLAGNQAFGVLPFPFEDDFDDANANGWDEYDGIFSIVGAGFNYQMESTAFGNDARSVAGDLGWTDYVIDLDFNMTRSDLTTHAAAVLFRVSEIASGLDAGKYYQLGITKDHVEFTELNYSGGSGNVLASTSYTLSLDTWHNVRITVEGTQASAYIDDGHVLTHDGFDAYGSGKIGLKTINDGVVLFDNVLVTPEPATLCLLVVSGLALLRRRRRFRPSQ